MVVMSDPAVRAGLVGGFVGVIGFGFAFATIYTISSGGTYTFTRSTGDVATSSSEVDRVNRPGAFWGFTLLLTVIATGLMTLGIWVISHAGKVAAWLASRPPAH